MKDIWPTLFRPMRVRTDGFGMLDNIAQNKKENTYEIKNISANKRNDAYNKQHLSLFIAYREVQRKVRGQAEPFRSY